MWKPTLRRSKKMLWGEPGKGQPKSNAQHVKLKRMRLQNPYKLIDDIFRRKKQSFSNTTELNSWLAAVQYGIITCCYTLTHMFYPPFVVCGAFRPTLKWNIPKRSQEKNAVWTINPGSWWRMDGPTLPMKKLSLMQFATCSVCNVSRSADGFAK